MPIVYLSRRLVFSASHRLHSPQLSDAENQRIFGKCNQPNGHGHNYVLEVVVRGEVDAKTGMVINLTDLKRTIADTIEAEMDHRHLNLDCPSLKGINPTTENLVVVFWKLLSARLPSGMLHELRLHETENNVAIYRGE
jgi:6-pyruvoyltetrahydropterin/6-carboxytetrahydropterin synthase